MSGEYGTCVLCGEYVCNHIHTCKEKQMNEKSDYCYCFGDRCDRHSIERFEQLEYKLTITVEALEFYGNEINWRKFGIDYVVIKPEDQYFVKGQVLCGGKKAREALEKIIVDKQD